MQCFTEYVILSLFVHLWIMYLEMCQRAEKVGAASQWWSNDVDGLCYYCSVCVKIVLCVCVFSAVTSRSCILSFRALNLSGFLSCRGSSGRVKADWQLIVTVATAICY